MVASPVVEHGIEPLSPALAGKFLTTEPPGTLVTQFLIKTFKYLYTHTHTHTHTHIYTCTYIYIWGRNLSEGVLKLDAKC